MLTAILKNLKCEAAVDGGDPAVPAGGDPYAGGKGEGGDPPARPDHIPEKFWDGEKGEVRIEDVFKSYGELEGKLGQDRGELLEELKSEQFKDRPKDPGDYLIDPEKISLPAGFELEPEGGDPLVEWWRGTAHNMGLSNEMFNEGVKMYLENAAAMAPNPEKVKEALGDNGASRVEAVDAYLAKTLGAESELYSKAAAHFTTPEQIEVIEALMQKQAPMAASGDEGQAGVITKAEIETMMKDPKYWHPTRRDVAYVEKVEAAWRKLAAAGKLE